MENFKVVIEYLTKADQVVVTTTQGYQMGNEIIIGKPVNSVQIFDGNEILLRDVTVEFNKLVDHIRVTVTEESAKPITVTGRIRGAWRVLAGGEVEHEK
jgi:hypothetical protein